MESLSPNIDSSKRLVCPKCKEGKLQERVPRSFFVKTFLFFVPMKRYRCYKCNKKPYIVIKS